ncbi:glycosyltransferase [Mesonia sp. K4-1]|uniref:glycosyltransferase n=1 Tax=Mesonia sp. K4-1 TaxID=2602760 RepID=UPI0011C7CD58|nr:glycosyltransferase [Mesonia sp. K4-1]TXK77879.1 glycosyltransferase family 4 protein [Mesonia sp. K4-1]
MNKNILYIGGFNFVTENASSIRVIENARFLKQLGYNCVVMGKTECNLVKYYKDIKLINIQTSNNRDIDFSTNCISVISEIESFATPPIVIAYNYPTIAFYKLQKYCKNNNIVLIPDITEWHGIDGRISILKILRYILNNYKMRHLNKKCKNIILATDHLSNLYGKSNQLILPFVTIDKTGPTSFKSNNMRRFIFAGTLGENFSKDRLDILIKAFAKLNAKQFEVHIVGPSKQELFSSCIAKDLKMLSEKIKIYGRVPNRKVKHIMKSTDFVIFARNVKRITKVGYPTKVFEAFKMGIPVITNRTSNLDKHIINNKNGFLIKELNVDKFVEVLEKAIDMPSTDLKKMKEECVLNNPFYYKNHEENIIKFFKNLQI